MRRTRRPWPGSVSATAWCQPDTLAGVDGLVKSVLYSPWPKASVWDRDEGESRTQKETPHGPVLHRGQ
jgi:hypothetical protein